jgi:hypothetical protein
MVQGVFWEEDWKRILSIPIKHGMEDLLAWHLDSKGKFSVKSVYHVLDDCRERETSRQHGEGSSSVGQSSHHGFGWQKIWKLQCPPKVKHFFWRFTHNSLPVRRNISRRGMEIDTRCPVCWRLDENGGHCFLKCKYVKQCWRTLNLEEERIAWLVCPRPCKFQPMSFHYLRRRSFSLSAFSSHGGMLAIRPMRVINGEPLRRLYTKLEW